MDKKKHINQGEINEIWRKEWDSVDPDTEAIFGHRLFVEGYPVIKKYILGEAGEILDAGGGTGRYGVMMARDFPGSRVIVSDILEESLRLGEKLAGKLEVRNVIFQKDDILNSLFQNDRFNVVLSDAAIQHLPEYRKAVKELVRITKPGGRVIIAVNNWWNLPHTVYKFIRGRNYEYGYERSFIKWELRKIMEREGTKIIGEDGFYPGYGIFRLKKHHRIFRFLSRAVNRLSKILDKFTNRFFSRNFGMQIVIVGEKI